MICSAKILTGTWDGLSIVAVGVHPMHAPCQPSLVIVNLNQVIICPFNADKILLNTDEKPIECSSLFQASNCQEEKGQGNHLVDASEVAVRWPHQSSVSLTPGCWHAPNRIMEGVLCLVKVGSM